MSNAKYGISFAGHFPSIRSGFEAEGLRFGVHKDEEAENADSGGRAIREEQTRPAAGRENRGEAALPGNLSPPRSGDERSNRTASTGSGFFLGYHRSVL